MGKRLFKKLFGRRKPSQAIAARPALPKRRFQQADYLRFIKKQLGFQSKYFPHLTEIHNVMLRKINFHKKDKVPVITGDRMADTFLARNMQEMCRLEARINDLRLAATKINDPKNSLQIATRLSEDARAAETRFNDLKNANFKIFLEFFQQRKNPSQTK